MFDYLDGFDFALENCSTHFSTSALRNFHNLPILCAGNPLSLTHLYTVSLFTPR